MNERTMPQQLDWEVISHPVYDTNLQPIPRYQHLFRDDNQETLAVAKSTYRPLSNKEFSAVVEEMSDISQQKIVGYDTFQGGRKVLAYLDGGGVSLGGYPAERYTLIGNSHDGSTSFFIGHVNKVLRCQNQFSQINMQHKVSHTSRSDLRIRALLRAQESVMKQQQRFEDNALLLQLVDVNVDMVDLAIQAVLDIDRHDTTISTRKKNIYKDIKRSINREFNELGQNGFGLFNGFTYYTTHVRNSNQQSLLGNPLGGLATINKKAWDFCENQVLDTLTVE